MASLTIIVGVFPFVLSFAALYIWSTHVIFPLIPKLFGLSSVSINHKELGLADFKLDHNDSISSSLYKMVKKIHSPPPNDNSNTHHHFHHVHNHHPHHNSYQLFRFPFSFFAKLDLHYLIEHIFAITFSLSLLIMELCLCEVDEIFNRDSRLIVWNVILPFLIIFLIYIIPALLVLLFVKRNFPTLGLKSILLIMITSLTAWLYLLSELDVISGINTDGLQHTYLSKSLSEITLLGVSAIGCLGGVGTISNPYYEFIKKRRIVTEFDLKKIADSLKNTDELLKKRQLELEEVQEKILRNENYYNNNNNNNINNINKNNSGRNGSRKGSLAGIFIKNTIFGNNDEDEDNDNNPSYNINNSDDILRNDLENEISILIQMKNSLYSDLGNLSKRFENQQKIQTFEGKITNFFKKLFSLYCVYKIFCVFCIQLPTDLFKAWKNDDNDRLGALQQERDSDITKDALAVTVAKIISSIRTTSDIEALVNQLSFVLAGSLFLCSISSVMTTFHSISKFFPINITNTTVTTTVSAPSMATNLSTSTTSSTATLNNGSTSTTHSKSFIRSLMISEITGIYMLATVLLLRSNLPESLSSNVNQALGAPLEVEFVDDWFNKVFTISSVLAGIGIALGEYLNGGFSGKEYLDDDDSLFYYDEEEMIEGDKLA
ncbi:hypothetical protein PACTADRAFT_50607 [Pachysolen tannophilus NRRL Y-2460]|uniref:Abscisic acid G-protein coupled receptor-like domain-containing protein n=1 Tax=Pachysolen tannophilus NRRL Y-2460 TaxID=669874 RepID=A0A1E4TSP1_PACTA|nr:hypothetical protein PACTADRAFT_50607 [Pachysolen tannophilus NRRL Y-2460]